MEGAVGVVGKASMALDLAGIVRIVLWEVSQVLPTVVHGGKIIEICVIYLLKRNGA